MNEIAILWIILIVGSLIGIAWQLYSQKKAK